MRIPNQIISDLAGCNALAEALGLPYRIAISRKDEHDRLAIMKDSVLILILMKCDEQALCDVLVIVAALNSAWAEDKQADDYLYGAAPFNERPA